jgi:peroxiredoxin
VLLLAATLLATSVPPASAADRAAPSATLSTASPAEPGSESRSDSRSRIEKGTRAPDFQYQSYDQLWQHLHNLLEHGDLLLVFGASDVDLRTLERERETLVKNGVTPFAVVERNEREVWASVRRLGLTFSLLADPRGVIGAQYGVYDTGLGRSRSAWFVIDRKGRVRQRGEGMPSQSWPAVTTLALGRPDKGAQAAARR